MTAINYSRLTQAQAETALATCEAALAAHADICSVCKAARDGTGFRIWRVCNETGAPLIRTHLAVSHRLAYLAKQAARRAKKQTQE